MLPDVRNPGDFHKCYLQCERWVHPPAPWRGREVLGRGNVLTGVCPNSDECPGSGASSQMTVTNAHT